MSREIASFDFKREGAVSVADLSGEVDMSNAGEVRQRLLQFVSNEDHGLVLDLSGLSFIDSAGLHVVLEVMTLLEERSKQLSLVVPPDIHPARTIALFGLDEFVAVYPDREAALNAARSWPVS
jgi:anti-anti-sigma factor